MSKKPEGKYDPTLVPQVFIEMVSRVREYGISKHGNRDDWLTTHPNEHYKSAMRHLLAAIDGEEFDESGFPHIAMAVCNLMFEIVRENYKFVIEREVEEEQGRYEKQLFLDFDPAEVEDELEKIISTDRAGNVSILEQNIRRLEAEKSLSRTIGEMKKFTEKVKALEESQG